MIMMIMIVIMLKVRYVRAVQVRNSLTAAIEHCTLLILVRVLSLCHILDSTP